MKIAKLIAAAGVCMASSAMAQSHVSHDTVAVAAPAMKMVSAQRAAQITKYYSPTHFEIGPWIDLTASEPRGESVLDFAINQGQFDSTGSWVGGCGDPSFPDGSRYFLIDANPGPLYTNLIHQNDYTSWAAGATGDMDAWFTGVGIQADSDFFVAVTVFDDFGPDQSCSPAASSFHSGVVFGFGFLLGDIDGYNADGHQGFYGLNATDLVNNGISLNLPADGNGTVQDAYGQAYDDVTNTLTLHADAQPALWCDSQWGGEPGRPGASDFVGYWDDDNSGDLDPALECFDNTFGALCAEILEPMLGLYGEIGGDTCPCTADLTGDTCGTNTNDFFAFLTCYQNQDPCANYFADANGDIDTNDFFAYLAAYQGDLNNVDCPN